MYSLVSSLVCLRINFHSFIQLHAVLRTFSKVQATIQSFAHLLSCLDGKGNSMKYKVKACAIAKVNVVDLDLSFFRPGGGWLARRNFPWSLRCWHVRFTTYKTCICTKHKQKKRQTDTHTHTHTHTHIHTHTHARTHTLTGTHTYIQTKSWTHSHTHAHTHTHTHTHTRIHAHIYTDT